MEPPDRRSRYTLGALTVASCLHSSSLLLHIPILTAIPYYFWHFTDKPLGPWWLLGVLALIPLGCIMLVERSPLRARVMLPILMLAGYAMQMGFGWLEGRGLDGIRDRIAVASHAEFARVAVQEEDVAATVLNYGELAPTGALGAFAQTKPPGTLLLYVATERLTQALFRANTPAIRLRNLHTFASLVWPAITYLALIPLYFIAILLFDRKTALRACVLYVSIPSVVLITMHADGVFFPLLVTLALAWALYGVLYDRWWLALVAGVTCYAAAFCSYGLLAAIPLIAVAAVGCRRPGSRWPLSAGAIALGFVLADVVCRAVLSYEIEDGYARATRAHILHKGWDGEISTVAYFVLLNTLEFCSWIGLPVALLAIGAIASSVRALRHRVVTPAHTFALAVGFTLLLVATIGKTKSEVARLWMFFIPPVCILAASSLERHKSLRMAPVLVVMLEFISTAITKHSQDFH